MTSSGGTFWEVGKEDQLRELAELVGQQAGNLDVWTSAELCVLEVLLRERLTTLGIQPSPEVGACMMAVAQLLSERSPEFGGDARDALAEVAVLGLRLLEPEEP
ncbi:MAG: hypothetical protein M3314_01920 [Actinomycetota bacterium]|nr:hypothetical protein [Actinomycetota bacterium]